MNSALEFTLFGIRLSILDFGGLAVPLDHNSVRANFSLFHPARARCQVVQGVFLSLSLQRFPARPPDSPWTA